MACECVHIVWWPSCMCVNLVFRSLWACGRNELHVELHGLVVRAKVWALGGLCICHDFPKLWWDENVIDLVLCF